ncbi:hypothetical protein, partial [Alkalibacterium sp. s-m-28]
EWIIKSDFLKFFSPMGEKAPFFQTVNQSTKLRTILNYKLIIRVRESTGKPSIPYLKKQAEACLHE